MEVAMIAIRGFALVPWTQLSFDLSRERSKRAVEEVMREKESVFLICQRDPKKEEPEMPEDFYEVGCLARIVQVYSNSQEPDLVRVRVMVHQRAALRQILSCHPYLRAEAEPFETEDDLAGESGEAREMMLEQLKQVFSQYLAESTVMNPEIKERIESVNDLATLCDMTESNLQLSVEWRQILLKTKKLSERVRLLYRLTEEASKLHALREELQQKVRRRLDQNQREYFLREELKLIHEELGQEDKIDLFRRKLADLHLPEEKHRHIEREIDRLEGFSSEGPDAASLLNYLETLFDLPWGKVSETMLDLAKAKKILERDHYGMEKVKERVIEYLAVYLLKEKAFQTLEQKHREKLAAKGESEREREAYENERFTLLRAPILCLVGAPGVGKTSIARSIAEALGRRFERMSLGGVSDEAEIRGHRRTYVGAMPGRLIKAILQAGTDNPLILLDEIDKMSHNFRGDPASALLEVLDPEQNNKFRDHYLEVSYDLSRALFITTANSLDTIPAPLLDRMEVIELRPYTEHEKREIAKRHLLPKLLRENALEKTSLRISDAALLEVVRRYTREAGVRQFERVLSTAVRKAAVEHVRDGKTKLSLTVKNLEAYLGKADFDYEQSSSVDQVGVCTGLAWTAGGGDILSIEVNTMPGSGKVEMTGSLGDVMKESVQVAMGYIRSRYADFGLAEDFYKKIDLHVHVPEGATPKDGPSAGITLASALISALTGRKLRHRFAMTGELTLRGHVLAIGGLKEKLIAAVRSGIREVCIPEKNANRLDELPETVRQALTIYPVKTMDEVLEKILI